MRLHHCRGWDARSDSEKKSITFLKRVFLSHRESGCCLCFHTTVALFFSSFPIFFLNRLEDRFAVTSKIDFKSLYPCSLVAIQILKCIFNKEINNMAETAPSAYLPLRYFQRISLIKIRRNRVVLVYNS